MKELGIFIDESGDFGTVKERPAYYLVTFIFHDQDNNINEQVSKLEESVHNSGFKVEYIHTGPILRREDVFAGYSIDERRKLLYKMLNFVFSAHRTNNRFVTLPANKGSFSISMQALITIRSSR